MIKAGSPDTWFIAVVAAVAAIIATFAHLASGVAGDGYPVAAALLSVAALFAAAGFAILIKRGG